jgi:4-amino-4-deoxy-L-arabinose transferase-like glycosyltransferase
LSIVEGVDASPDCVFRSTVNHSEDRQISNSSNPQMKSRTRTDALLLAGFCGFLFFYGLGKFGLIGADEPRYAQVAREMLERHDWITPVLGGQPWLEKPPLYYWQAMFAYSLFGVSDWAARVPSAIDATLMVVVLYFFFRRFRRGIELDAALITASCAGVIGYARAASMDMALASTFTVGMLAWWAWQETAKRTYLALFYAFLALGTLAKGPVAPVLGAVVILLYAAIARDLRSAMKTLWLPGILVFCVIALPWYLAVQVRNPQFFREFILEHNVARFSTNLYHHIEPFWYYLPVALLALVPWTVFVAVALVQSIRTWWAEKKSIPVAESDLNLQFSVFACCWLIAPIVFFSLSQSKLPGYILPALPAAALLLGGYLRQHLNHVDGESVPRWLALLHAMVAAVWIVPALLIAYLTTQHRFPAGQPFLVGLAMAFVLAAAIAVTLTSRLGLRMLRFVTLIPVVLSVAAVLKLGSASLDQTLSARALALEIASMQTHPLPLAVNRVPREIEYGLTFYRNQSTFRYEWGRVLPEEHLLVAPENSMNEVAKQTAGRHVSFLGHYAPQHVDYFWIAATGGSSKH